MFWFNFILGLNSIFLCCWSCMIMSKTKDKCEPQHTFVVYYTYTPSRARVIFSDIPIGFKVRFTFRWILPTVNYACETCNLTKQQTFKLPTLQRVRERIMLNITWRDHKTAQYIRAKKNKVGDIMEMIIKLKWYWAGYLARITDNLWTTCITFGTPPGTYTEPRN